MKKRAAVMVTGILIVLLALSGCAQKQPAAVEGPPTGGVSTLDFDALGENLTLNGVKVSLPATLEELGGNYYFLGTKVKAHFDDESVNTRAIIIYSDDYETTLEEDGAAMNKVTVIVNDPDGASEEDIYTDSPITGLFAYSGGEVDFAIDTIGFESTKEDVLAAFGDPTTYGKNEEGQMEWYTYVAPGTGQITVAFQDDKIQKLEFLNYKNDGQVK